MLTALRAYAQPPSSLAGRLSVQSLIFATGEGAFLAGSAVYFGVILGLSLGQAAKSVRANTRADIVFVVCDGGWKYLSTGAYEGTIDEAEERLEGQLWA